MRSSFVIFAAVGLAACQTPPDPRWRTIDRAAHPQANAVVLLDEARIAFDDTHADGLTMTRRTRIKVLTPRGRDAAEVGIPLNAWTTLEDFEAWSSDVQGDSRMTSDKSTVYTVPMRPDAGVLYSDVRVARTVIPGVDVGDVFEYRYTVRIKQTFALPTWLFEGELPVLESRLMVENRPNLKLGWSFADNGEIQTFLPKRTEDWIIWERRDQPAFEPIEFGPPAAEQLARLRLSLFTSPAGGTWGSLAGWYKGLAASRMALPADERKAIKALVSGKSEAERARLVFERVRDRIRYVATHEGIGGFQPHAVKEVLRTGYGDCKDMVTMTLAYAQAADLEAHPVLIGTAGHGVFDPKLPSVSSFNHVIAALRVDGTLQLADPTAKDSAWGDLPWPLQGRTGLLVGRGKAKLLTLKARPAETNQTQVKWQLSADSTLALTATLTGLDAEAWRGLRTPHAQARAVRARFFGTMKSATIETSTVQQAGTAIKVTATARWPDLWRTLGGQKQGLALHPFLGRFAEVRVPAGHQTTVHLGPPHSSRIEIALPWAQGPLPKASQSETPFGSSVWTVDHADGQARLAHVFTIKQATVPADGLAALRQLTEHGTQISRGLLVRPVEAPTEGNEQ